MNILIITLVVILAITIMIALHYNLKSKRLNSSLESIQFNFVRVESDLSAWKRRAMYIENLNASELKNRFENRIDYEVLKYITNDVRFWKGHKYIADNLNITEDLVRQSIRRLMKVKAVKLKQIRSLDGNTANGSGYVKFDS